jgi:hypothetical protein
MKHSATLTVSSQALLPLFGSDTSNTPISSTRTNGSAQSLCFEAVKPAILTSDKFVSFGVPRRSSFKRLLSYYKLTSRCEDVLPALDHKEYWGDMSGGFCRVDRPSFSRQDAARAINLLASDSGKKLRPGTLEEFLFYLKSQSPRRDLPDLILILGNLLFTGALFTKVASEFDLLLEGEPLDRSLLIFCVQETR